MEILPADTYRVAEIAIDGKEIYVTTAHVSQLKSWKILRGNEDQSGEDTQSESDESQAELTSETKQCEKEEIIQPATTRTRRVRKQPGSSQELFTQLKKKKKGHLYVLTTKQYYLVY